MNGNATKMRRGALACLGLALAAGCAGVPRSAAAPEVELVGLAMVGATSERQRFALTFLLRNSNAEPVPVAEIGYRVRLAGQGYLTGRATEPLVLAGAGFRTVRVEVESDGVASASSLLALAGGPDADTLAYELSGELVLGGRPPRVLPFASAGDVTLAVPRD